MLEMPVVSIEMSKQTNENLRGNRRSGAILEPSFCCAVWIATSYVLRNGFETVHLCFLPLGYRESTNGMVVIETIFY